MATEAVNAEGPGESVQLARPGMEALPIEDSWRCLDCVLLCLVIVSYLLLPMHRHHRHPHRHRCPLRIGPFLSMVDFEYHHDVNEAADAISLDVKVL